jgi:hypothetical protein
VHLVSFNPVSKQSLLAYHPSVTIEPWLLPSFHLKRFWITVGAIQRLRTLVCQRQPQIVHVHYLGHAAWLAALARLRPLVISVMGETSRAARGVHPRSVTHSDASRPAPERPGPVGHDLAAIGPLLEPGTVSRLSCG